MRGYVVSLLFAASVIATALPSRAVATPLFVLDTDEASYTLIHRVNPQTGQLMIQLSYTDHGNSLLDSAFGIHGIVDTIEPIEESMICIGQNAPPGGNELIFLGRYYLTSSAPSSFPSTCPTRDSATTPLCRFKVIVRDNDNNDAPSSGDYFHITLSSGTALTSELVPATVFYTRAGELSSGNLTVN